MSALLFALGGGLGGGLGAVARDGVGRLVPGHPAVATLCVNVGGSFVLGLLVAASVPAHPVLLGFCGGFTTFSTFAAQTLTLGPLRGAVNVATNLGAGWAAFAIGLRVAS